MTGLTYMQQRYYDPQIGRFLSVDPVTAYEKPGQNFNRYWYANVNPYKFSDPDGRNAVAFIGGVISESWDALSGRDFDSEMVMGALKDGYDGEGNGFASAAIEDATTLIPAGAAAAGTLKVVRGFVQSIKVASRAKANKIHHIFSKQGHNLGNLVKAHGNENKAYKAIEKATNKAVDSSKPGRFEIKVEVGGEQVTVRGNVVEGEVKIGTAFIRKDPK